MSDLEDFNDNQEIARERKGTQLGALSEEPKQYEADVRDQIPEGLRRVLIEKDVGDKVTDKWDQGNALRADQLERQRKLLLDLDEFMEPIYVKPQEWMSDLHIPMSFIVCKAFHARMYSAIMGQDPSFTTKAQKEANSERAMIVQDLMHYATKRWANKYQGIEDAVDDWLWAWCTSGTGHLKQRWDKEYTRFVDIENSAIEGPGQIVEGQFSPTVDIESRIVKKDELIFEGPIVEHVPDEDLLIIGGNGDPDKADLVIHQVYMSAHQMWCLADKKVFDKETVKEIIAEASEDRVSEEPVNQIKSDRVQHSGEGGTPDQQSVIDRYQILEAYLKIDVDGSGISSDVIVWVHKKTRKILRATYLYRVMATGLKPFSTIHFHRRQGQSSAVGLVELIYPLAKEMDAMHNMKVDFGLLSTMPIGFYRATSSLQKERIPLAPGNLIPLDDPHRDINFPSIGNRSVFADSEEQALFGIISRVTGLGDLNFGVVGAQGALRTATGARALINESNANLDIYLRRANRGFKKTLVYLFHMLKQKLPPGFEFRITGMDGKNYFRQVASRFELMGMYDFEIEPNSANSNKQVQIETAQQTLQLVQNPLLIQLGVVTGANLFEAAKNLLQTMGVKDWSRFLTPPQQGSRRFLPIEIVNRVMSGNDVQLTPDQDLQGFLALAQEFLGDDSLLGQFNGDQVQALQAKMNEAQQMIAALEEVAAQQANANQVQTNAALASAAAPGMMSGNGPVAPTGGA